MYIVAFIDLFIKLLCIHKYHIHLYVHTTYTFIHTCTYQYKAMNCESRRPRKQRSPQREGIRQRTERMNEINGHKRSARRRRSSKQEGNKAGKLRKSSAANEQGKSFAFHLARRLTVQQRSIDVCHGSARRGVVNFSVLKRAERRVRARNIKADAKVSQKNKCRVIKYKLVAGSVGRQMLLCCSVLLQKPQK